MRTWIDCDTCGPAVAVNDVHYCPEPSEYRDEVRGPMVALVYALGAVIVGLLIVVVASLTAAGVIPS